MVECARLEIAYTGNRIKGSNPFVSARIHAALRRFLLKNSTFYDIIAHNNRTQCAHLFYPAPRYPMSKGKPGKDLIIYVEY